MNIIPFKSVERKSYYIKELDMSIIMQTTYMGNSVEIVECRGLYYGIPNEKLDEQYDCITSIINDDYIIDMNIVNVEIWTSLTRVIGCYIEELDVTVNVQLVTMFDKEEIYRTILAGINQGKPDEETLDQHTVGCLLLLREQ